LAIRRAHDQFVADWRETTWSRSGVRIEPGWPVNLHEAVGSLLIDPEPSGDGVVAVIGRDAELLFHEFGAGARFATRISDLNSGFGLGNGRNSWLLAPIDDQLEWRKDLPVSDADRDAGSRLRVADYIRSFAMGSCDPPSAARQFRAPEMLSRLIPPLDIASVKSNTVLADKPLGLEVAIFDRL